MARLTTILNFKDKASKKFIQTADRLKNIKTQQDKITKSTSGLNSQVDKLSAGYIKQGSTASNSFKKTINETERAKKSFMGFSSLSPFKTLRTGASGFFSYMRKQIFSLRTLLASLGAAAFFKFTIGGAAEIERQILTFSALLKSEVAGQTLFDQLTEKANESIFALEDFGQASQRFMTFTKDLGQIEDLIDLTERLSFTDLTQGFEGAGFAMKELLGADFQSLKERFGISTRELEKFGVKAAAKSGDIDKLIKSFDNLLTQKGFTAEFVAEVNMSGFAQLENLMSNVKTQFKLAGESALQELLPSLKEINKAFKDGDYEGFFKGLGTLLAGVIKGAIDIGNALSYAANASGPGFDILKNLLSWIVFNGMPLLAEGIITASDYAVKFSDFIQSNFPTIITIVSGITSAFLAYKAVVFLSTIATTGFATAIKIATAAQKLFNIILSLNPIGVFIGLVIGAVVAIATFASANEKFRQNFASVFGFVVDFFESTVNYLIGGVNKIIQANNAFTDFMYDIWKGINNFIIDKIDGIVDAINKIPGVNIDFDAEGLKKADALMFDAQSNMLKFNEIAKKADFSKFKEAGKSAIESFDAGKLVDKIKKATTFDLTGEAVDVDLKPDKVDMGNAVADKFTTPDFNATGEKDFVLNEYTIDNLGNIIDPSKLTRMSSFVDRLPESNLSDQAVTVTRTDTIDATKLAESIKASVSGGVSKQDNRTYRIVLSENTVIQNEADEDRLIEKAVRAFENILETEIETESDLVVG